MRRFIGVALVAVVGIAPLMVASPAAAGGGNWVESDEKYNAIGSEATVRTSFYADKKSTLAAAPYFVYLDRLDHAGQGWDLPKVGKPDVHRVGKVQLMWDVQPRFLPGGRMLATFEVPRVEPGRYLLTVCDRGCEHRLGDTFTTGFFWIVGTPAEARARTRADAIQTRFRDYRNEDRRQDVRTVRRHRSELEVATDAEEEARTDLALTRDTIAELRHDLDTSAGRVDDMTAQRNFARAALLLTIAIAAAVLLRRRQTDLELETLLKDVREGGDRDLFELVGSADGGFLDVADLPEVDRRRDEDHVGVR